MVPEGWFNHLLPSTILFRNLIRKIIKIVHVTLAISNCPMYSKKIIVGLCCQISTKQIHHRRIKMQFSLGKALRKLLFYNYSMTRDPCSQCKVHLTLLVPIQILFLNRLSIYSIARQYQIYPSHNNSRLVLEVVFL